MSGTDFPFEGSVRRRLRQLRQLAASVGLIGYADANGAAVPVQGDEYGPYVRPMARTANTDGTSPVQTTADQPQLILVDAHGRLLVGDGFSSGAAGALSLFSSSTAVQVGQSVKATAGRIFQMRALMTDPGGHRYAMVFNKASAPVNGDTPVWRALLPDPGGTVPGEVQDNWGDIGGLYLSTGVAVAVSSTIATLTLPAEDVYWHITYL